MASPFINPVRSARESQAESFLRRNRSSQQDVPMDRMLRRECVSVGPSGYRFADGSVVRKDTYRRCLTATVVQPRLASR